MNGRIRTTVVVFAVLNIAVAAQGIAQTAGCERLTAADLPYIDEAGVYCLTEDVTVNLDSGVAIQILVNDVVLDLGGHLVRNMAHDSGTSVGILGYDLQRVTVRNGRIQGFERGVEISTIHDTPRGLVLVEDLQILGPTFMGIYVTGARGIIRRNTVRGVISRQGSYCYSIAAWYGVYRVIDNDVHEIVALSESVGISLNGSEHTVVSDNRISGADRGIVGPGGGSAICRDNVTMDMATSTITGCVDGGGNV